MRPLKLSQNRFCMGLPGAMKCQVPRLEALTLTRRAHSTRHFEDVREWLMTGVAASHLNRHATAQADGQKATFIGGLRRRSGRLLATAPKRAGVVPRVNHDSTD